MGNELLERRFGHRFMQDIAIIFEKPYGLSHATLLITLSLSQLLALLGGQLAWKLVSLSCTALVGWTVWVLWGRPPLTVGGGT